MNKLFETKLLTIENKHKAYLVTLCAVISQYYQLYFFVRENSEHNYFLYLGEEFNNKYLDQYEIFKTFIYGWLAAQNIFLEKDLETKEEIKKELKELEIEEHE